MTKKLPDFEIYSRRYLGSKAKLIEFIDNVISNECKGSQSFADLFAGTGVVAGHFFRRYNIIVNDILQSNFKNYDTWFGNTKVSKSKILTILEEVNSKQEGIRMNYFSKNFSDNFFSEKNAKKIGFFREKIKKLKGSNLINSREENILLTSLIYATDKVANTCGHYDAFRKNLDQTQNIVFHMPKFNTDVSKKALILNQDANQLVKNIASDIFYIDPPYNSRQYSDAYHLLENLVMWKKPELTGVAKKYTNRKKIKSQYCLKNAPDIFQDLIQNLNGRYIVVSYNNTEKTGNDRSHSKISKEEILETLSTRGSVKVFGQNHKQFTTGKTLKKADHQELLYVCSVK